MAESEIDLSIVIPTYQRRESLERTLATLFNQDFDGSRYEVIVVVDGSTDGTSEFLRTMPPPSCAFRVIEQPNKGQASARNAGLRAATGDVVLFLDDDLVCDQGLVAAHVKHHREEGANVVWGVILPDPERRDLAADLFAERLSRFTCAIRSGAYSQSLDVMCGANSSTSRKVLLRVGGYDERFIRSLEDLELAIRLWKGGIGIRYAPEGIVYHTYDKSADYLVEHYAADLGRAEVLLCRTHPDYKPFSRLTRLFRARLTRRLALQLVARLPHSVEPLLRIPCAAAQTMRGIPGIRWIGMRLVAARITTVELRAAVKQVGSWRAFREEFDC